MKLAAVLVSIALFVALPLTIATPLTFLTIVFAKSLAVLGIFLLLQAGQVSFGHGMFYAATAYTAAYIGIAWPGPDLLVLTLAAIAVSAIFGLVIGIFVSRYRYIFFAMLNLAFSMVLFALLEKLFHYTGGTDGLRVSRPTLFGATLDRASFDLVMYYYALALVVLASALIWLYLRSPLGQALKALKVNETRLEYVGLSANVTILVAYVFSAVLAGLGGLAFGLVQGLATPELTFWTRSGEFVFIAMLGGIGNWNPFRALSAIPQKREMMDLLELVDCAVIADRPAAELAEGQRKLVDIAIALALKPKLLLLDEPTSGVASANKFRIMEILIAALRQQHVSSVFVEHDMEVVTRYASRVAVWSEGKIQMIGAPDVVMNDPDVIRTVIGGS